MTGAHQTAIDAALSLCDAVESLRHPKHARIVNPLADRVQRVMAGYFRDQKRALIHWLKYRITEAVRRSSKRRAAVLLPDELSPLVFGVTLHEEIEYRGAIESAVGQAASQLAREIGSEAALSNTAMDRYLRQNSLSKLAGDLEDKSRKDLRQAIADAVDRGATGDEIVGAIEQVMDGFATARAETIAQTEVNSAYNFGRHEIARVAGMNEKSWVTESGDPCLICIANEGQGWIPIGAPFLSGDQYPVAHPRCYCSTDFRSISK